MTSAAYVAESGDWEGRVEYVHGELLAMSGGTPRHAAVTANVVGAVMAVTRGSGCRVTSADQRVHIPTMDSYVYPDAQIVCGRYALAEDGLSVTNPTVVIEVLSPSTRSHDLVVKFELYRQLTSVQHIVYIDPDVEHVMVYDRTPAGWLLRDVRDGDLVLGTLMRIPLAALYADLESLEPAAET